MKIDKYDFTIEITGNGYYYLDEFKSADDTYIAGICGIMLTELQKVMYEQYNGFLYKPIKSLTQLIYFKTQKDAENALQWVESMILMNKLRGA